MNHRYVGAFCATIGLLCLVGIARAQAAPPAITFGVSGKSTDGKTVAPVLTWSTTPAATSCTASGDPAWTGTQPDHGTLTLPATSASKAFALSCSWPGVTRVSLSWIAPTVNADGTPYADPGGFRVQYSKNAADLSVSAYIQDPLAVSWTSPPLNAGTWYFAVRAYNVYGLESDLSNTASRVTTADATRTASISLVLKVPGAPSGAAVQ